MTQIVATRLTELEAVIERGLETFVEVGMALAQIQQERLYRENYSNFEDYCRARWSISRPRAYQLIESAATVNDLSTMVDAPPPTNERQVRELSKIKDPETRAKVWKEANETAAKFKRPVTAKAVREVATASPIQKIVDDFVSTLPSPQPVIEEPEVQQLGIKKKFDRKEAARLVSAVVWDVNYQAKQHPELSNAFESILDNIRVALEYIERR